MSFVGFLQRLLREGEVVLAGPPVLTEKERRPALDFLAGAYDAYCLEIAGPLLPFQAPIALAASELVGQACWFLLHHGETVADMERRLVLPVGRATAAHHLSADLVLRLLPQVHRRAHALAPDDRLPAALAAILRQWPLSGVLADVTEPPLTPPEFDGHPGLLLLYAERLARNEKPAWVPEGRGREYVQLVFTGLGKERSPLLARPDEVGA